MDTTSSRDALEYLVQLGAEKNPGVVQLPPCEPPHRWGFWNPEKQELEIHEAQYPPKCFSMQSVHDLRDALLDIGGAETRVFVAMNAVVAVIDAKNSPRDRVFARLAFTDAFEVLSSWRGGGSLNQAAMIAKLRRVFHASDLSKLLPKVRSLRFQKSSNTDANISHGNETITADVRKQAMAGGEALPEYAEFAVQVYNDWAQEEPCIIKCSVDVDIDRQTISVSPLSGEIEKALRVVHGAIAEFIRKGLKEKGALVWCGVPN